MLLYHFVVAGYLAHLSSRPECICWAIPVETLKNLAHSERGFAIVNVCEKCGHFIF